MNSPRRLAAAFGLACVLAALAGCTERDPYRRTDVWQPTGASAGNLAAQVADPNDLIRGRGATRVDGHNATTAVERLWNGTPRPVNVIGATTGMSGGAGSGS